MQWINGHTIIEITEFVRGLFAGIAVAGSTREEALGGENNEYWFNWNSDIEVHVFKDDITDEWNCTAYQCNDYSQFFGNESTPIPLGEKWQ